MVIKRVLVTVGTTRFDELIKQVHSDTILNKLEALGYTEITLQTGNGHGEIPERTHATLKMNYVRFIDDFIEEIKHSDLIISHAGAGSCLDVLRCGKPLIVVINEELMDNHQEELAEELQSDKFVYYCNVKGLKSALDNDIKLLKRFPKYSNSLFSPYLNKVMGF